LRRETPLVDNLDSLPWKILVDDSNFEGLLMFLSSYGEAFGIVQDKFYCPRFSGVCCHKEGIEKSIGIETVSEQIC
jgi:hypothetical protein